jgi:hypothetical protein
MRHTRSMPDLGSLAEVSAVASQSAIGAWDAISGFLVIIIPTFVLFYIGWYIGRGPFVAILLALYSAYALYAVFPFVDLLPSAPAITALATRLGLYGALALLFYIIMRRIVVSDFLYIGMMGIMLLSLLGATFLIALAYHVFPVADVYQFNAALDPFFAPSRYFFWWFIGPAVGLFFLAR